MRNEHENKYFDRKSAQIRPVELASLISAFANAEGGTVVLGISDKTRRLEGINFAGAAPLYCCEYGNSVMRPVSLSENASGRVKGMIGLREIVEDLIRYQMEDYPEEMIQERQQALGSAYDAFTAEYGLIKSRSNAQAFSDDSSYYLLCSLENLDENGRLKSKADMFTRRTIRPKRVITHTDTPAEALCYVQPKDLDASEIDVRLGATWLDVEDIQDFMEETFKTPYYLRHTIEVYYSLVTSEWQVSKKLEELYSQREAAQEELGKPFPQARELAEKSARLAA